MQKDEIETTTSKIFYVTFSFIMDLCCNNSEFSTYKLLVKTIGYAMDSAIASLAHNHIDRYQLMLDRQNQLYPLFESLKGHSSNLHLYNSNEFLNIG